MILERDPPSSNNSVLGSEAVDGSILHAESNDTLALAILHQEIKGKVLHKVTGVITQRLQRRQSRNRDMK